MQCTGPHAPTPFMRGPQWWSASIDANSFWSPDLALVCLCSRQRGPDVLNRHADEGERGSRESEPSLSFQRGEKVRIVVEIRPGDFLIVFLAGEDGPRYDDCPNRRYGTSHKDQRQHAVPRLV